LLAPGTMLEVSARPCCDAFRFSELSNLGSSALCCSNVCLKRKRLRFSVPATLFPQEVILFCSLQQTAPEFSIDHQNVLAPFRRLSALVSRAVSCLVSDSDCRPALGRNVVYKIEFHVYWNWRSIEPPETLVANASHRDSTM
jgi:hypothetical protein